MAFTEEDLKKAVEDLVSNSAPTYSWLIEALYERMVESGPNFFQNHTQLWCLQQIRQIFEGLKQAPQPWVAPGISPGYFWIETIQGWKLCTLMGGKLCIMPHKGGGGLTTK